MVPELAIPKEETVEVCIYKLATGVHDAQKKMARVQLELNLQITQLQLRAQPSTLSYVQEQRETAVTEVVAAVNSVVADCTQLFEKSFEVLTSLQEDPNVKWLETEVHELQQCYDEVKGTM